MAFLPTANPQQLTPREDYEGHLLKKTCPLFLRNVNIS
ncbi:hypothetical protein O53_3354 [Microcystis aeruginosa TAIHU98]|uniref:Uncharacterized protein n=1 Tax=Microcystis aeruginosa TAIHU98 TaxID=1134457 RepID=L7E7B8_MICAE|nr:hypothetical protein O53_3354 [Microcystis aeruginosa TAIHU98]ODV36368.1 hypothetical protein BFG60_4183 [Microcystis aeruginosa NIES-98]